MKVLQRLPNLTRHGGNPRAANPKKVYVRVILSLETLSKYIALEYWASVQALSEFGSEFWSLD